MASTATQQGKSQPHGLHHNFSSPDMKPLRIQRLLKYDMAGGERRSAPARDSPCAPTPIGEGVDDGGLKELSKKLLNHLRETADKMKLGMPPISPPLLPPPRETEAEEKGGNQVDHLIAGDAARPWNLRTRRTAPRATASPAKTVRVRSEGSEKKKRRPRFSVSLSREEIEEDIFVLTGSRPRRRPKKRLRNVQWLLDAIFPGLWLSEITLELYKVAG